MSNTHIVFKGEEYVMVPDKNSCDGCAFMGLKQLKNCQDVRAAYGDCDDVILIKAINTPGPVKVVLDDIPEQPNQETNPMSQIDNILTERGNRYGEFEVHASITQELKAVMHDSPNWRSGRLTPDMKEALEMVAHKMGRILNGDPFYKDSWVDIEGYVHLVSKTLRD